jgi:hypothetical protein
MIPFSAPGMEQKAVLLESGTDVMFWTDFKASFDGKIDAKYHIELLQDGDVVATATCDPIAATGNGRFCGLLVEGITYHHIQCRMHCSARVPKSGPTLVRATLSIGREADGLRLERADLSIEQ